MMLTHGASEAFEVDLCGVPTRMVGLPLPRSLWGWLPEVAPGVSSFGKVAAMDMAHCLYLACPQDGSAWKRDPFQESGLHLSPTAAEAKEKARATRVNKRAPQMDWNRKREIFSNF